MNAHENTKKILLCAHLKIRWILDEERHIASNISRLCWSMRLCLFSLKWMHWKLDSANYCQCLANTMCWSKHRITHWRLTTENFPNCEECVGVRLNEFMIASLFEFWARLKNLTDKCAHNENGKMGKTTKGNRINKNKAKYKFGSLSVDGRFSFLLIFFAKTFNKELFVSFFLSSFA